MSVKCSKNFLNYILPEIIRDTNLKSITLETNANTEQILKCTGIKKVFKIEQKIFKIIPKLPFIWNQF